MEIIELLNFNKELLNKIYNTGIRLDDFLYIDLYNEYIEKKKQGEKVTYIVAIISEKYSVSERKVYNIIRRFKGRCKTFAV